MQFTVLTILLIIIAASAAAQRLPRGKHDHHREWFERADANKNGKIERAEFDDDASRMFADSDKNGNGTIEESELPPPRRDGEPPRPGGDRFGGEKLRDAPRPPKMPPFAAEDTNGDGKLTRAEFDQNMNRHFSRLDKNENGEISREEMDSMPERKPRREPPPAAATVMFLGAEMRFGDKLVKNSPFSAETVMENTRRLFDGSTVTAQSKGAIYRDGAGRTRREQPLEMVGSFSLGDAAQKMIFITDAGEGVQYFLDTTRKTARRIPLNADRPAQASPESEAEKTESLGTKILEGVGAEGTRTTIEIPAGRVGNDKPLQVVTERWYSSELQTIIMTRHVDPLLGEQVFRLTNIKRGEPSRDLFVVPTDYRIETDRRFEDRKQ